MTTAHVALTAALVFAYALVSRWLSHRSISGPMVFVLAGLGLHAVGIDLVDQDSFGHVVELLAEAALVIILFSDATRIDLKLLRTQAAMPARLLGIGLPLTIAAGTGVGLFLLSDLAVYEAAVLAAILAPTDAALGQAVVSDKRVPIRIRQALNVESGLNDGLMVPVVTVLVGLAAAEVGEAGDWATFVGKQLGFGLTIGVAIGLVGAKALDWFSERGWVEGALRQLAVVALAIGAFAGAESLDGNGFVAAFIAGVVFGAAAPRKCDSATDFAQDEGELLVLLTFLFWSVQFVTPQVGELTWEVGLYVALSLTVVRIIPVAVSTLGMRLEAATTLYLGWFGPRGLASILFVFYAVEHLESSPATETMLLVATWTVLASVILHGLSAVPGASRYGAWFTSMSQDELEGMPEVVEVDPMRTRDSHEIGRIGNRDRMERIEHTRQDEP